MTIEEFENKLTELCSSAVEEGTPFNDIHTALSRFKFLYGILYSNNLERQITNKLNIKDQEENK